MRSKWNKYRSLKIRIMLQTLGISLLVGIFGYLFIFVFVDGVLQAPFADSMVHFFEKFGFDNESAIHLYRAIFWDNKTMIISTGFIFLFLCSFYLGMSRFTTYLRQIESGIDMILTDSSDLIELEPELQPMENRLNEIKANLKEQRRQTQESEQRKNDLVVYLAHDLKTPLTSVIAYLSLLSEAPDMPLEQRAKYTHISLEKAKRLVDLINEFFEITRYNLQNITLEKKTFYLYVLLEQVLDSFEPVFQERGLICRTEIEDSILIHGDPDKLARVFENLLRNGVSYCYPNSAIEVSASGEDKEAVIRIRNQGKEIPKHKLENLFEKFYRLDEARSTETGGAGLGLAIARDIVELHQGTITANSNKDFTEFIVRLPMEQKEEP